MEPTLKLTEKMEVVGIEVRTTNQQELSLSSARIPGLWGQFYQEQIPDKIPNKKPSGFSVGVYSDYESDHTGAYSLLAGVEVANIRVIPAGMVGMTVPSGKYLFFTAQGPMPQALIQTWSAIWDYFSNGTKYRRAYTVDFELYRAHDRVDIYVAVE